MPKRTEMRLRGWFDLAALIGAALMCCVLPLPAMAQPSGADGNDFLYRVQQGDTLISLADRYMDDAEGWRQLQQHNHIANPYQLQPGSIVRIPFDRIPVVQAAAQVVFARDAMTADRKPLQAGMKLSEDALIETGAKGAVTLAFDDGTRVTVPPGSRVTLARVRSFARTGLIDVRLQVKQGEVESTVAPRKTGVGRYEISTPALVTGVRGTRFRVGAAGDVSTESVLEGQVAVRAGRQAQAVGAGFGVRAAGGRLKRVALPAAPKLDAVPKLVQVPCFRPTWQPVKGAVAYRAMIARDPEQTEILSYQLSQTPAATLCGDEDGTYTLAVQSVDALGLSGPSATRPFTVRLHPEAPYMIQPASDKPYRSGEMAFAWASVAEAATYDLEAAGAPDFAQPAVQQHGQEVRVTQSLRPGTWWWRVRSVDKDGKTGPWSDAVRFRALDIPADSVPPPSADAGDDGMLHAHWRALDPALADAGARTRVQLAAEPTFAKPVADLVSAGNEAMIPLPPAGPYYIRTGIDLGDAASVVFARPQRIDIGSFVVDAQGASVQSGGASLLLDDRSRKAGPR
ncbi:FecR domain-containing protein [Ralstonia solanacearum]|uniref:FecR family protein n=1 Tax=Ralstonia solanacearum TaxID=305 RepID=UPI0005065E76|nr:FecR domain-containing protein [Ralstonia solanacearum]KFX30345.1 peptidoglycan-binding protein LysM [Ralstonia solanacearum]